MLEGGRLRRHLNEPPSNTLGESVALRGILDEFRPDRPPTCGIGPEGQLQGQQFGAFVARGMMDGVVPAYGGALSGDGGFRAVVFLFEMGDGDPPGSPATGGSIVPTRFTLRRRSRGLGFSAGAIRPGKIRRPPLLGALDSSVALLGSAFSHVSESTATTTTGSLITVHVCRPEQHTVVSDSGTPQAELGRWPLA